MSKPYLHANLWLLVLKNLPLENLLTLKCFRDLQDFENRYVWKHREIIIQIYRYTFKSAEVLIIYSRFKHVNASLNNFVYRPIEKFEEFGMFLKYEQIDKVRI